MVRRRLFENNDDDDDDNVSRKSNRIFHGYKQIVCLVVLICRFVVLTYNSFKHFVPAQCGSIDSFVEL